MLRAVVTAADMTMPILKPQAVLEAEQVSLKFLNELGNSSAIGRVWKAEAAYRAPGTPSVMDSLGPFPEIVKGNSGETAWAKGLIEGAADLELVGKFKRGTHGAWLARTEQGENQIFKFVSNDDTRTQLKLSADSAQAVNSTIARTPQYRQIGFTPEKGSWYTQEFLPGFPAPAPTDRLITRMLILNDNAAGKGIASGKNWSEDVMNALYKDSKGWQKNIAESGEEGKQFVAEIQAMVDRNRLVNPISRDVVHGDFQHYNALVDKRGKLTAYVDWEGAGKGDRGIDLSRLLYDSYVAEAEIGFKVNPITLQMMRDRIAGISGQAQRDNYMSYWALQVADYGLKRSPADGKMFMGVGRRILEDLKANKPGMTFDIAA